LIPTDILVSKPTTQLRPLGQYIAPRYWPTWVFYGFLRLVAKLPFSWQIAIGTFLGKLSYHLAKDRRDAAEVNIRLCFPELSAREQEALVRKTFVANGIGLVEIAMAWFGDKDRFNDKISVTGLSNFQTAKAKGKGVLLLGAHFSTLEMGGLLFSKVDELDATYRPNDNPFFDAIMFNGRKRNLSGLFDRKSIRQAMKSLRAGKVLWYAPDQDYGPKNSVFAPFFGNDAATIIATSRYAAFNDSPVIFFSHYRNEDNSGYTIDFSPIIENYPTGDDVKDATTINQAVETAIRRHPDQYLWLHKRFKTQKAGEHARPYNDKKARLARG